jgi:hypothetical protein
MTSSATARGHVYGYRARIGYTSPPLTTEIFPYEFYKIVPAGVTLVLTTLAIVVRSKEEIERSYWAAFPSICRRGTPMRSR